MPSRAREFGAFTCFHCGYSLDGLPLEGRCPECGERYVAGAGPVWLDEHCIPHCNRCGQRLGGLPRKGNCPGCGEWYTCQRLVAAPSFRRRRMAINDAVGNLLWRIIPSFRTVALALFFCANAAVVGGLAWYAWKKFLASTGAGGWCWGW